MKDKQYNEIKLAAFYDELDKTAFIGDVLIPGMMGYGDKQEGRPVATSMAKGGLTGSGANILAAKLMGMPNNAAAAMGVLGAGVGMGTAGIGRAMAYSPNELKDPAKLSDNSKDFPGV